MSVVRKAGKIFTKHGKEISKAQAGTAKMATKRAEKMAVERAANKVSSMAAPLSKKQNLSKLGLTKGTEFDKMIPGIADKQRASAVKKAMGEAVTDDGSSVVNEVINSLKSGPQKSGAEVVSEAVEQAVPKEPRKIGRRTRAYMDERYNAKMKDIGKLYDSSGKPVAGAAESVISEMRLGEDQVEAVQKKLAEGQKSLSGYLEGQKGNYAESANLLDSAYANRIPQIGATAVGGAWLVQNMSDNRGRQSNSQLYGQ